MPASPRVVWCVSLAAHSVVRVVCGALRLCCVLTVAVWCHSLCDMRVCCVVACVVLRVCEQRFRRRDGVLGVRVWHLRRRRRRAVSELHDRSLQRRFRTGVCTVRVCVCTVCVLRVVWCVSEWCACVVCVACVFVSCVCASYRARACTHHLCVAYVVSVCRVLCVVRVVCVHNRIVARRVKPAVSQPSAG